MSIKPWCSLESSARRQRKHNESPPTYKQQQHSDSRLIDSDRDFLARSVTKQRHVGTYVLALHLMMFAKRMNVHYSTKSSEGPLPGIALSPDEPVSSHPADNDIVAN